MTCTSHLTELRFSGKDLKIFAIKLGRKKKTNLILNFEIKILFLSN